MFVPNAEAVDFDETAGLGYGLPACDGIVGGAIRENYQDFPGFRLLAEFLGGPEQGLRQGCAARRFELEI